MNITQRVKGRYGLGGLGLFGGFISLFSSSILDNKIIKDTLADAKLDKEQGKLIDQLQLLEDRAEIIADAQIAIETLHKEHRE